MLKHLLWVVLLMTFSFPKAHSFVFIEPLVGYSTGSLQVDASYMGINLRESVDIKGLNYGIRGGFQFGGFQLAADFVQNNLKASGSSYDFEGEETKIKEYAGLLGYRFWYMRVYGGLIFRAEIEEENLDPGIGYKAGLSFYIFRNVALNLEYRHVRFDTDIDSSGVIIETEYNQVAFLLSFPFGP